ncbi:hypothetical protein [Amycolatopsis suaedae]|uniref:hypothetical protein n=1 Tax=Amycolatopsis suaedae TaxID=2510978 RepID=UPI0013EF0981|nr:hypothetical protein [Amycolatopsis suaedae]
MRKFAKVGVSAIVVGTALFVGAGSANALIGGSIGLEPVIELPVQGDLQVELPQLPQLP